MMLVTDNDTCGENALEGNTGIFIERTDKKVKRKILSDIEDIYNN